MVMPEASDGLARSQLLRFCHRTFEDLKKQVERSSDPTVSPSTVDQILFEMEDASTKLNVPLPRWMDSEVKYRSTGLYSKRGVSDFLGRVVGRFEEALATDNYHTETVLSAGIRVKLAELPMPDTHVRTFVEEALRCLDARCFRAAVVLSWCGAIALLQARVIAEHLADFNNEALRRDTKWRAAQVAEDLGRMREFEFLQILEAINVLTRSVRTELEGCLRLRNSCGHPTELQVSQVRVAAHLESLLLNVFSPLSGAG